MSDTTVDLKKTVNLPKTDFSMKANLPTAEPKLLAKWEADKLYHAIRKARSGEIVVGQRLVNRMLNQIASGTHETSTPLDCLTDRELEIFRLLGRCRLRREIAQQLHLSVKTIESHQSNMREKLGLSSIIQLRKLAAEFLCAEAAAPARP